MGEEKKTTSWVPIIGSGLALVGVIITAYFGYLQSRSGHELEKYKFDNTHKEQSGGGTVVKKTSNNESVIKDIAVSELVPEVQYSLDTYSGVHMRIGNTASKGIIVVSDLTLHWGYSECPQYREPTIGAPLIEYRYEVDITKDRGSKIVDKRDFKYGPGEIDDFYIDINYPGLGVYHIWAEFKYSEFGKNQLKIYQSQKSSLEKCVKW